MYGKRWNWSKLKTIMLKIVNYEYSLYLIDVKVMVGFFAQTPYLIEHYSKTPHITG